MFLLLRFVIVIEISYYLLLILRFAICYYCTLSYLENIAQISAVFRDQLQPPLERAVYWTEYVIRHGGARHLRSPELDLSWIQLLHLDILLVLHLVLFILYKTGRKLTSVCCRAKKPTYKKKKLA